MGVSKATYRQCTLLRMDRVTLEMLVDRGGDLLFCILCAVHEIRKLRDTVLSGWLRTHHTMSRRTIRECQALRTLSEQSSSIVPLIELGVPWPK